VRPVNPIVEELRKARTTDENGEGEEEEEAADDEEEDPALP
jgi:hypothetical protein